MTDASNLSSTLEEIRERHASTDGPFHERWLRAQWDVPRLLAAIEAVLELHRPVGDGCAAGGCTWSWPCPTYRVISRELTKGENDGT